MTQRVPRHHCKAADPISTMYGLLSADFIHGNRTVNGAEREDGLSCEFVDRDTPVNLAPFIERVQTIMAMVFMEILHCIPKEDGFEDDGLLALNLVSGLLLPIVAFRPGHEQAELPEKLLDALSQVEFERPKNQSKIH